jgi:hypothetical protein
MSMSIQEYEKWSAYMKEQKKQPGSIIYTKGAPEMYEQTATLGPQVEARQDPPVVVEMNQLEKNIAAMGDLLAQLESRLNPVLMQEPSVPRDTIGKEPRGTSPLVHALRNFNSHLSMMRTQVANLRDRVEI